MEVLNQEIGERFAAYNADCVEFSQSLPDNSIDFTVYSPPFSNIYTYSDSERDMGNVEDDAAFFENYRYMVREKLRITRPGRLTAIHVKDIPYHQGSSERGDSGLRPFSDLCTQVHREEGWSFHCRITIWRDPVLERGKTNAHGLLRKTRRADASFCRVGMPEYLMIYRKWATEETAHMVKPISNPNYPTELWQQEASPVWDGETIWNYRLGQSGKGDYDLRATEVLNVKAAKDEEAIKHLCPMPLNVTRRALTLWSAPDDVVFSPFMGIGSEGWESLRAGRRFIGTELKGSYYDTAVVNLREAAAAGEGPDIFADSSAMESTA
ncbi:DNA methyltransferase [Phenylobacterium sp.]|uniref:DNA-methyltransferase n=1 Tax=Phenylobacterium sp. TaxID=1871053 RepID=UPI00271B15BC|nr:DNA methyltransferase [Phenylobacterium sp.]MDO8800069.1 DNA methyltransferase [Phenylobacterium sp.]